MGWKELRERAKQFAQQADAALAEDIAQDSLLSRTKVTRRRSYECIAEANTDLPDVGIEVRIIDMHSRIDVYAGNNPIGQVAPEQVELMREEECFEQRRGRSVRGLVTRVSKLSERFFVEITH